MPIFSEKYFLRYFIFDFDFGNLEILIFSSIHVLAVFWGFRGFLFRKNSKRFKLQNPFKVVRQRSPQGGGAMVPLAPPNKYRDRAFLKAGIDSKTCSVDRKSHSAYVRKKSWPKIWFQKKVRAFFRKQKPRNVCHLKNINQIPLKIHWGKSPWSIRETSK